MRARGKQTRRPRALRAAAGFSLIELLIVVAIILVILAIAIPNYMRSRMLANESAAVSSCRNITTAEVVYSSTYGIGYSATLARLGPDPGGAPPSAINAALIDDVLAAGTKSGYSFSYSPGAPDASGMRPSFALWANPQTPGTTGQRYFYTDNSGVIRQNNSAPAGPNDTAI